MLQGSELDFKYLVKNQERNTSLVVKSNVEEGGVMDYRLYRQVYM